MLQVLVQTKSLTTSRDHTAKEFTVSCWTQVYMIPMATHLSNCYTDIMPVNSRESLGLLVWNCCHCRQTRPDVCVYTTGQSWENSTQMNEVRPQRWNWEQYPMIILPSLLDMEYHLSKTDLWGVNAWDQICWCFLAVSMFPGN